MFWCVRRDDELGAFALEGVEGAVDRRPSRRLARNRSPARAAADRRASGRRFRRECRPVRRRRGRGRSESARRAAGLGVRRRPHEDVRAHPPEPRLRDPVVQHLRVGVVEFVVAEGDEETLVEAVEPQRRRESSGRRPSAHPGGTCSSPKEKGSRQREAPEPGALRLRARAGGHAPARARPRGRRADPRSCKCR